MKCFNHHASDAIGLCKACGRGLCPACVTEVGRSCSCRERCEADVATLNDLVERNRTVYQKTSATYFRAGFLTILLGILFIIVGVLCLSSENGNGWGLILIVLGVLFGGMGVSHLVSAKRMQEK